MPPVKLIVGLGNPGEKYRLHRHNMGFLVLDQLALQVKIPISQKGFGARYGTGRIHDISVLLAEPLTFMNLSGTAVKRLMDYFKADLEDLIVVHDDLDLPFMTIRLKTGGGHGGHKGLMSIMDHLGGADFLRVRLGIGKPSEKALVESYVLHPFSDAEMKSLPNITTEASHAVVEMVSSGIEAAMRKYHGKTVTNINEEVL